MHERQELRQEALEFRGRARADIRATIAAKRSEKAVLLQELRRQEADGCPTHVSSVRLSTADEEEVCAMLQSQEFASMKLPSSSNSAPRAPEQHVRVMLDKQIADMQLPPSSPAPWWCKYVCAAQNRHLFRDVVFECTVEDSVSYWLSPELTLRRILLNV